MFYSFCVFFLYSLQTHNEMCRKSLNIIHFFFSAPGQFWHEWSRFVRGNNKKNTNKPKSPVFRWSLITRYLYLYLCDAFDWQRQQNQWETVAFPSFAWFKPIFFNPFIFPVCRTHFVFKLIQFSFSFASKSPIWLILMCFRCFAYQFAHIRYLCMRIHATKEAKKTNIFSQIATSYKP